MQHWERLYPLEYIGENEINELFYKFNESDVIKYRAAAGGFRNSNYIVTTNKGCCLLRICVDEAAYANETAVSKVLQKSISMPKLLYHSKTDDRRFLIYEYIKSVPLNKAIEGKGKIAAEYIGQAARAAAVLHSYKNIPGLRKLQVPPFKEWYGCFLSDKNTADKLGREIADRVLAMLELKQAELDEIDKYQAVIHSDFRVQNMIVDANNILHVVDWEYCTTGHILADIGQFFRNRSYFKAEDCLIFETEYNKHAKVKLPSGWDDLSRLRDLVNPLQLLSRNAAAPKLFENMKDLVLETLEYFEN